MLDSRGSATRFSSSGSQESNPPITALHATFWTQATGFIELTVWRDISLKSMTKLHLYRSFANLVRSFCHPPIAPVFVRSIDTAKMSPNPLFFICILFTLTLLHVRASPAISARADSASTFSDIPLTIDPGFAEPSPRIGLSEDPSDCFTQPRSPGPPRLFPVSRQHCVELVFRLVIRPQSTLAFQWDPKTIHFPVRFRLLTCAISVYSGAEGIMDVFSVIAVARVAGLIINQCATPDKEYLGGRLGIGAKGAFWVSVSGYPQ